MSRARRFRQRTSDANSWSLVKVCLAYSRNSPEARAVGAEWMKGTEGEMKVRRRWGEECRVQVLLQVQWRASAGCWQRRDMNWLTFWIYEPYLGKKLYFSKLENGLSSLIVSFFMFLEHFLGSQFYARGRVSSSMNESDPVVLSQVVLAHRNIVTCGYDFPNIHSQVDF